MPHLICVRHRAILTQSRAGLATAHGRRQSKGRDIGHCDPSRRCLVLAGGVSADRETKADPFDVSAGLADATKAAEARRRSGAAIGTELMFIASADAFRSVKAFENADTGADGSVAASGVAHIDGASILRMVVKENGWSCQWLEDSIAVNEYERRELPFRLPERWAEVTRHADGETRTWLESFDPKKVIQWLALLLDACASDTRWRVACWRLDLDEEAPHLSVFVVPLRESINKSGVRSKWVSVRTHFDKRRQLSELQDWGGEICAPLGLVRGTPRSETNARHVSPSRYRFQKLKQGEADIAVREAVLAKQAEALATERAALADEWATLAAERAAFEEMHALAERDVKDQRQRLECDIDKASAAAHAAVGVLELNQDRPGSPELARLINTGLIRHMPSQADAIKAYFTAWTTHATALAHRPRPTAPRPTMPISTLDDLDTESVTDHYKSPT